MSWVAFAAPPLPPSFWLGVGVDKKPMKYSDEITEWIATEAILGTDSQMIARAASNKFKQKISAREVRKIAAGYVRRDRKDANGKEMDTGRNKPGA